MIYLTRMLGKPVIDAAGDEIGTINDIAIATGEVFPRVTSLAFRGPDKTPFMLSWRKYVEEFDGDAIRLNAPRPELRFSYQQPDEVLLARDLLSRQIVDTQGMKVVRVNDLKLSESRNQLRLLGAEVGVRGILRGIAPWVEHTVDWTVRLFGGQMPESIIAWNYMDLVERDLSAVKLSVTHKRLHELHPADVADVLEQLTAGQRAKVFEHLDNDQAAEAISELEDDLQADVLDDLTDERASDILEIMDPDDAADIIGDLPYDKAEALLRLMGVKEARQVRKLLGYRDKTAGGIMTPEVTTVTEDMTVQQVVEHLRGAAAENENIYYIYVVGAKRLLEGVISLRDLVVSEPGTLVGEIVERDMFTVGPDDDQEDVAELMGKYDLLAIPVVDEAGRILGMVTVDDALDVLEEESAEDLALATGGRAGERLLGLWRWVSRDGWLIVWAALFLTAAALPDDMAAVAVIGVALSTVVLRVSEDVASHAMSRVISDEDTGRGVLLRRLAQEALAGLGLGLVVGLLAAAVFGLGARSFETAGEGWALQPGTWTIIVGAVYGISVLLTVVSGTAVGYIAQLRAAADKRVSGVAVSLVLAVVAVVWLIVLAFGAWTFVVYPLSTVVG